jgi:predicted dienelactone hydrolase
VRLAYLLIIPALLSGQNSPPTYFSVPGSDAPELARRGNYAVGVRTLDLVHTGQPDILHLNKETGKAPLYDRPLKVEVWYPAVLPPGMEEKVVYQDAGSVQIAGKALRDAAPVTGQRFPLVIVSHGYPGTRFFLSYLTENLASKGYVVAAIGHTDSVVGDIKPFQSTLLNRSSDQLFTVSAIEELSQRQDSFLHGLVDAKNSAIVGYSMGGYGALISAGAGLSSASPLTKGGLLQDWTADSAEFKSLPRDHIKAMVAIAPWGAQAPYQAWDNTALASIHIPSLFIVGDHDDVAGFKDGPKRVFEQAVNSERCLLVYENARHNTGGNPAPPDARLDYRELQHFEEPVWRKDRITAINQHFITAFLDLYLKGEEGRRPFLRVPVPNSGDGTWVAPPNTPDDGAFSTGKDQQGHPFWPGFERRWALGLEMSCSNAAP